MREEQQRLTRTVMDLRTRIERLRDSPGEAHNAAAVSGALPGTDQSEEGEAEADVADEAASSDDSAPGTAGRGRTWV